MCAHNQKAKLYCPCGKSEWDSFLNSEHFCRYCDTWLIFRNGHLIKSIPISSSRRRVL